jgi:hypothetical protein
MKKGLGSKNFPTVVYFLLMWNRTKEVKMSELERKFYKLVLVNYNLNYCVQQ